MKLMTDVSAHVAMQAETWTNDQLADSVSVLHPGGPLCVACLTHPCRRLCPVQDEATHDYISSIVHTISQHLVQVR